MKKTGCNLIQICSHNSDSFFCDGAKHHHFPEAVRGQLRCIPLRKEWLRLSSDAVTAPQSQRNRLDLPSPMRRANQPACGPSLSQRYNTLDFASKAVCHETSGFFGFFLPRGRCPLWIPLPTGMLRAPYWMTLRQRKASALLWNLLPAFIPRSYCMPQCDQLGFTPGTDTGIRH